MILKRNLFFAIKNSLKEKRISSRHFRASSIDTKVPKRNLITKFGWSSSICYFLLSCFAFQKAPIHFKLLENFTSQHGIQSVLLHLFCKLLFVFVISMTYFCLRKVFVKKFDLDVWNLKKPLRATVCLFQINLLNLKNNLELNKTVHVFELRENVLCWTRENFLQFVKGFAL